MSNPLTPDELSTLLGWLPEPLSARFQLQGAAELSNLSARFPGLDFALRYVELDASAGRDVLLALYALQLQEQQHGASLCLLSIESRGKNRSHVTINPTDRELNIAYESPMPDYVSEMLKYLPNELTVKLYQSAPSPESMLRNAPLPLPESRKKFKAPQPSEVITINIKKT